MSSIPLSNEKISFTASLQEGWSGGQGSGDKSRAVKPDFPGLAREQKVLTTDEAFSKPLYLHPIETVNKTLKNQGPTTRGIMNTSTVVDNFGVSANYIQNGSSEEESFFQDREAKKEGSNWFVADNVKWPAAGTVSFYAYAPYNVSSLQWKGDDKVAQNKTIHYKVPENVEEQPDFIVAKSEGNSFKSSSANTPVDLQFSHALTAITFSVSDDMIPGTVKSITVSGVYGQGDYDFSNASWPPTSLANPSTYVITPKDPSVKAGESKALTDKNSALMMIPQNFGPNAKVSMKFNDGAKDKTVSFSLKGSWEAGKHITYMLSSSKITTLKMGKLTYPSGWNSVNQIRKAYASNTSAGLFVVNEKNKVIEANVQLTYDGTSWSLKGSKLKFSPQYNYFVYYPYQLGGLPGAPAKDASNIDVISAEKFFAKAIDYWKSHKITADQSTPDKMNACDLQIGKASLDEDGCSVSFKMEHAMGLAEITLGAKTFEHANYKLFNYESYTWTNKTTFHAYAGISGYSFYQVADYRYVALVKPGETTGFSCGNTTDADAWTENVLSVKPAANGVAKVTATSRRTPESYILYTMEPGDIYYSDGAMTHQSEAPAFGKTPIGIVGYIGNDYWTEKDVVNSEKKTVGGHALVMCLKTIGSTGSTVEAQEEYEKTRNNNGPKVTAYVGNMYAWCSSPLYNRDEGDMENVNSKDKIVKSKNQPYGSGYKDTNYLINKWKSEAAAATAAQNYNTLPANSSKCTGWFLPSAGQYYAVIKTLGAPFSDDWTGIYDGNTTTHPDLGFFSNMTTGTKDITKNINDKLKKVGDSNYTEFFGDINTWAWTSSEFSSTDAVGLDSGVDDPPGAGSVRFNRCYYGDKTAKLPVRPFLAF